MTTGLVIIDVQNDYFAGGHFPLAAPEEALTPIKNLLTYFRAEKMPIFHIKHLNPPEAPFFIPGTKGADIHSEAAPLKDELVITKHYPNSFLKTNLKTELEKHCITDLVVCGMMTQMCIDTTVRTAMNYGYPVTLISDACAALDLVWKGEVIPADIVQKVYWASLDKTFAAVMDSKSFLKQQHSDI